MRRRLGGLCAVALLAAAACGAQCVADIKSVPMSTRHLRVPPGVHPPLGTFVDYSYPLGADRSLLLYSSIREINGGVRDDEGLLIVVDGTVTRTLSLAKLRVMRGMEDDVARYSFRAGAIARACSGGSPVYFLAFGYMGDSTSADLFVSIVPNGDGYILSALPMVAGGALDLSRSEPLRLRTWNNLFEGACNVCETRYEVSEFALREGEPELVKRFRTRRKYSDEIFNQGSRVRLIP